MGLDQYLCGRKFIMGSYAGGEERKEDGFTIQEIEVELHYWRKHPNLHGFIIQNFAPRAQGGEPANFGGEMEAGEPIDDCNPIELDVDAINQIIEAIKADQLPETKGFFFGESPKKEKRKKKDEPTEFEEQQAEDLAAMGKALSWLSGLGPDDKHVIRNVYYRSSWFMAAGAHPELRLDD